MAGIGGKAVDACSTPPDVPIEMRCPDKSQCSTIWWGENLRAVRPDVFGLGHQNKVEHCSANRLE